MIQILISDETSQDSIAATPKTENPFYQCPHCDDNFDSFDDVTNHIEDELSKMKRQSGFKWRGLRRQKLEKRKRTENKIILESIYLETLLIVMKPNACQNALIYLI